MKTITLNLDEMFQSDYYYTEFNIGCSGHSITVDLENKDKFLDAFAKEWRDRAESLLEESN